jgi:Polyketide cyclase / dehydrase and lipid transport
VNVTAKRAPKARYDKMAGMPLESKQISEWIDRPVADVYDYASDPAHLPQWAPGLGYSVENVGGEWFVETESGRAGFAFVERNKYGVLDHEVTLPSGDVIYNPMRVVPLGDGCEVVFSLRRLPDMSDEDFAGDAGLVQADLTRLKQILEATG